MNLKGRYFLGSAVVLGFFTLDIWLLFYAQATVGLIGSYPFFQALLPVSILCLVSIVVGLIIIGMKIYKSKRHQAVLEVCMGIYMAYMVICFVCIMPTLNSGSNALELISTVVIVPKPIVIFSFIPLTEKYLLSEVPTQPFLKRITPFLVASGAWLIVRLLLLQ